MLLELGIVAVLIVINGLLAMSELAIVSSRPARLAGLVEKGVRGSRRALLALPRTWAHGLLPALVASAALALLALPLQLLLAKPASLVAVLPEGVLLVAVANAAVRVVQLGLAAGAGTLLYLSALVPGEDEL